MDHADRRRSRIDDRDILASRLSGSQKRPVVRAADGGANAEHNDRVFGRNIGEQYQKIAGTRLARMYRFLRSF